MMQLLDCDGRARGVLGSWFCPGPALAAGKHLAMNQPVYERSLSLPFKMKNYNIFKKLFT